MTMEELAYLFDMHAPKSKHDYAGTLTRGDVEELKEWMEGHNEPAAD